MVNRQTGWDKLDDVEVPDDPFAESEETVGVVDGSETLAADATAAVKAQFEDHQQKVFSSIVMAISSSQIYLITSCELLDAAWTALRNQFERDSLGNKFACF